jgi:hypothetical protein
MSLVNTPSGQDQAEGLRSMFGKDECKVICLACALDPDTIVHIGHGTAHTIKNNGYSVLMIDEVPLADRRTMSGFLYPTKYDLGQVFINSVALEKSIRKVEDKFWYATSTKLRHFFEERRAKYPSLDERLKSINMSFDYLLFATNQPEHNIVNFYGSSVQRILIASSEFESLSEAMNIIRKLSLLQNKGALPTLILGGTEEEANVAFEKLDSASQSSLSLPLEMLGWIQAIKIKRVTIDPDDLSVNEVSNGPSSEFVLPTTFFDKLKQKITE